MSEPDEQRPAQVEVVIRDERTTQLQVFGRFVWKLLVVILVTLAAMWVVGQIVRLLLDLPATGASAG
ncbi:MAG TPA: hypothetical protein VNT23_06675 [Gaiellaceae bacterium]|nr:hypothetical protein [Gaiellaceae bacterium]